MELPIQDIPAVSPVLTVPHSAVSSGAAHGPRPQQHVRYTPPISHQPPTPWAPPHQFVQLSLGGHPEGVQQEVEDEVDALPERQGAPGTAEGDLAEGEGESSQVKHIRAEGWRHPMGERCRLGVEPPSSGKEEWGPTVGPHCGSEGEEIRARIEVEGGYGNVSQQRVCQAGDQSITAANCKHRGRTPALSNTEMYSIGLTKGR